jgi:hypothetical protein
MRPRAFRLAVFLLVRAEKTGNRIDRSHTFRAFTCLVGLAGIMELPGGMISWMVSDIRLIKLSQLACLLRKVYSAKRRAPDEARVCAPTERDAAPDDRRLLRPAERVV